MNVTLDFTVLTCSEKGCGITFAVPTTWVAARRADHADWTCPNRHVRHWPQETNEERFLRERNQARIDLDNAQEEAERHRKAKVSAENKLKKAQAAK